MTDLAHLPLADIVRRCAHENEKFSARQQYDPSYCYELFRRAIDKRDQRAWELAYEEYRTQVASWVRKHKWFAQCREDAQHFIDRAFARMWVYLTPERFEKYQSLGSLLKLLKLCVNSAIVDHLRRAAHSAVLADIEDPHIVVRDPAPGTETQALERIRQERLWEELKARLRNDKERTVIEATFSQNLKPRQIIQLHPGTFRDVDEVYRIKENVLARLKRDPEFLTFLQTHA
jgi:DNA-directed RNA polymerase specialized sigma24 family protein